MPTTCDWGHNNRSVAFRVPAAPGAARRIEHRVAGADASPHLVLAAILAAMLHGTRHELAATAPAAGRVNTGRSAEFPGDLLAALERTRDSRLLRAYFPQKFLELFVELKRRECAALMRDILPVEHDFYL